MKSNGKNTGRKGQHTSGAAQNTDANKAQQLLLMFSSFAARGMKATAKQQIEEIKTLIAAGADVNAKNTEGRTAADYLEYNKKLQKLASYPELRELLTPTLAD